MPSFFSALFILFFVGSRWLHPAVLAVLAGVFAFLLYYALAIAIENIVSPFVARMECASLLASVLSMIISSVMVKEF